MATPSEIVTAIETALAQQAAAPGVVSVSIDGVTTTYNWDTAVKMLTFWERRAAIAAGTKRLVNTIDLRGA